MPRLPTYQPGDEPVRGYRLVQITALGGFRTEWTAVDPAGRPCRLSVCDVSVAWNRVARREYERATRLTHPNLTPAPAATLVDCHGRETDLLAATDETLRQQPLRLIVVRTGTGANLADRLRRLTPTEALFGGLPVVEILPYLSDAAAGIDFLNRPDHGPIVHGDIKPEALVLADGRVQVDWVGGIRIGDAERRPFHAGTPAYMPPEMIRNEPDPRSDQYSLAITYSELRTGRLPVPDDASLPEVLIRHFEGKLDFTHPLLTAGELAAVRRATSVRPADRFASCEQFVEAVRAGV